MHPSVDVPSELTRVGDGWELRCTEALVSRVFAEAQRRDALVHTLKQLDPQQPLDAQLERDSDGNWCLRAANCRWRLVADDQTYWVVAAEGEDPGAPNHRDRWRRDRARLARWIRDVRVVAPLLRKRSQEDGEPCRYDLPDGGWLGVVWSSEERLTFVEPPAGYSDDEARRLAALAAACVATLPGWRPLSTADGVYCLRLAEDHDGVGA